MCGSLSMCTCIQVCESVWVCAHMFRCQQKPEESTGFSGPGVIGGSYLCSVVPGKKT